MKRIPFEQLDPEVINLYDYSLRGEEEINDRLDFIRSFIELAGWKVEDYIAAIMGWNSPNLN